MFSSCSFQSAPALSSTWLATEATTSNYTNLTTASLGFDPFLPHIPIHMLSSVTTVVCVCLMCFLKGFWKNLGISHSAPHHINRTTEEHFYTCKNVLVIHRLCLSTASDDCKEKLCFHFILLLFLCSNCCVPMSQKDCLPWAAPSQPWMAGVGNLETCPTRGLSAVALTPAICLTCWTFITFPDPIKQTGLAKALKSLLQKAACLWIVAKSWNDPARS